MSLEESYFKKEICSPQLRPFERNVWKKRGRRRDAPSGASVRLSAQDVWAAAQLLSQRVVILKSFCCSIWTESRPKMAGNASVLLGKKTREQENGWLTLFFNKRRRTGLSVFWTLVFPTAPLSQNWLMGLPWRQWMRRPLEAPEGNEHNFSGREIPAPWNLSPRLHVPDGFFFSLRLNTAYVDKSLGSTKWL